MMMMMMMMMMLIILMIIITRFQSEDQGPWVYTSIYKYIREPPWYACLIRPNMQIIHKDVLNPIARFGWILMSTCPD
jgi:hypothetical protein